MFEQSGKNHLVQGFMSLGKLYRWMPQTDPASVSKHQKLLIKPAVRDRVYLQMGLTGNFQNSGSIFQMPRLWMEGGGQPWKSLLINFPHQV